MLRIFVSLMLALALLTQGAQAQARKTLESLLKEAEIEYTAIEGGEFKIPVTLENETLVVIAKEVAIGDGTVDSLKLLHFYTLVVEVPKGGAMPAQMLKKMAEINDSIFVGKVSLAGDVGVFYSSSMWLQNATAELLIQELVLAHIQRNQMKKTLQPFLEEG